MSSWYPADCVQRQLHARWLAQAAAQCELAACPGLCAAAGPAVHGPTLCLCRRLLPICATTAWSIDVCCVITVQGNLALGAAEFRHGPSTIAVGVVNGTLLGERCWLCYACRAGGSTAPRRHAAPPAVFPFSPRLLPWAWLISNLPHPCPAVRLNGTLLAEGSTAPIAGGSLKFAPMQVCGQLVGFVGRQCDFTLACLLAG